MKIYISVPFVCIVYGTLINAQCEAVGGSGWGCGDGQGLRIRNVCFPRFIRYPKEKGREKFILCSKKREKIIPRTEREKGFNLNLRYNFNFNSFLISKINEG